MNLSKRQNLKEVVLLFLKMGFTTFGGPAAFLGIAHDEVVKRRKWLDDNQFLDLVGATNLIPGPNAVEMAIHIGFLRAGWAGFWLGGISYTLPAVLIVMGLAWSYQRFGSMPQLIWVLYAVEPVVIAIITKALWSLGKQIFKEPLMVIIAISVLGLSLAGIDSILLLFAFGILIMVIKNFDRLKSILSGLKAIFPIYLTPLIQNTAHPFSLGSMFLTFLKIGSMLYGSGYVLLAFLRSDFVTRLGWLTEKQLIDAVAIGQVTPGPFFTTSTFIGYILAGIPGGILATIGIFFPSFLFVAVSNPYIPKMRQSPWFSAFLNGINAASLGLMAAVTIQMARAILIDPLKIIICGISLIVFVFSSVNTTWVIAAAILFAIGRYFFGI
jgi:chromate transporter